MTDFPSALMACVSLVLPYSVTIGDATELGTIAYQTPAQCWAPPATSVAPQKQAASGKVVERVPETAPTVKKRKRPHCKPGRVRNSRGWCVRR